MKYFEHKFGPYSFITHSPDFIYSTVTDFDGYLSICIS